MIYSSTSTNTNPKTIKSIQYKNPNDQKPHTIYSISSFDYSYMYGATAEHPIYLRCIPPEQREFTYKMTGLFAKGWNDQEIKENQTVNIPYFMPSKYKIMFADSIKYHFILQHPQHITAVYHTYNDTIQIWDILRCEYRTTSSDIPFVMLQLTRGESSDGTRNTINLIVKINAWNQNVDTTLEIMPDFYGYIQRTLLWFDGHAHLFIQYEHENNGIFTCTCDLTEMLADQGIQFTKIPSPHFSGGLMFYSLPHNSSGANPDCYTIISYGYYRWTSDEVAVSDALGNKTFISQSQFADT